MHGAFEKSLCGLYRKFQLAVGKNAGVQLVDIWSAKDLGFARVPPKLGPGEIKSRLRRPSQLWVDLLHEQSDPVAVYDKGVQQQSAWFRRTRWLPCCPRTTQDFCEPQRIGKAKLRATRFHQSIWIRKGLTDQCQAATRHPRFLQCTIGQYWELQS